MEKRYFVKFIGEKNVTVAVARTQDEAHLLTNNQYEETTEDFVEWVRSNTQEIER